MEEERILLKINGVYVIDDSPRLRIIHCCQCSEATMRAGVSHTHVSQPQSQVASTWNACFIQ